MTAVELLRHAVGIEPPPFATAQVEAVDCSQLAPVEFRADSVVVLRDEAGSARMALIVEVQQRHDARKSFSWPVYATVLRARLGCATALLVICPDRTVARWCEREIALGPSGTITPLAVHPGLIPLVTDHEQARSCPELAVLSATAHAETADAGPVMEAMLAGLATLDQGRAKLYLSYVMAVLPNVARKHLEAMMTTTRDYEEIAGRYLSHWVDKGRAEGEAKGRAEGEAKGREIGRAEGEAKGEAQGEARSILMVLESRGLEISPDTRDRIEQCNELALLDTWIRRAAVVGSADEIFA